MLIAHMSEVSWGSARQLADLGGARSHVWGWAGCSLLWSAFTGARQLNHALCVSHPSAGWPGHVLVATTEAQADKQRQEFFWKFRLRTASLPFLPYLLAKASPNSSSRTGHPVHRSGPCKVTWQRNLEWREISNAVKWCNLPHISPRHIWSWERANHSLGVWLSFSPSSASILNIHQDPKGLVPSPASYHVDRTSLTPRCMVRPTKQVSLVMKEWNEIT